jgi:hypothetical protein
MGQGNLGGVHSICLFKQEIVIDYYQLCPTIVYIKADSAICHLREGLVGNSLSRVFKTGNKYQETSSLF